MSTTSGSWVVSGCTHGIPETCHLGLRSGTWHKHCGQTNPEVPREWGCCKMYHVLASLQWCLRKGSFPLGEKSSPTIEKPDSAMAQGVQRLAIQLWYPQSWALEGGSPHYFFPSHVSSPPSHLLLPRNTACPNGSLSPGTLLGVLAHASPAHADPALVLAFTKVLYNTYRTVHTSSKQMSTV